MRPLVRRTLAAVAALPLLIGGVAACGSNEDPKATSGGSADLPEAGSKVEKEEFVKLIKAAADNATTAALELDLSAAGNDITADGVLDYQAEPPNMALKMTVPQLGDSPLELRLLDSTIYLSAEQMTQGKFVKFGLDDPNNPFGTGLSDTADPLKSLEKLEESMKGATFVGEEDVDGDNLAHYEVTVDSSKMGDTAALGGAAAADLPDEITYDIWFDPEDLIRRLTFDLADADTSVEMKLSDWGKPVTIEAPDKDQITEVPELAGDNSAS
jgi:hypothetical protein